MSTSESTSPLMQAPTSRRVRILLFASLALNAVFIGGLASAAFRHDRIPFSARGGAGQQNLAAYVMTLPAERRMTLFKAASDKRQALVQQRAVVRRARDDAQASLVLEPFDKEKYLAAQSRLVQAEHAQRLNQRDMIVEIANAMSPDERRSYSRWRGSSRGATAEPNDAPIEKR